MSADDGVDADADLFEIFGWGSGDGSDEPDTFDAEVEVTEAEVKKRYKNLARKLHPVWCMGLLYFLKN